MARSVAIYPGSFDPFTLGHADLVQRGARLFDEVIVAVGHNPAKSTGWFGVEERLALAAEACRGLENVRFTSFTGLLIRAAEREGATVILRGLRSPSDFDAEFRNGLANRDLAGIETLFLLTDPSTIFVSSSLVKEIAASGGDVSRYVPSAVNAALRARLASA